MSNRKLLWRDAANDKAVGTASWLARSVIGNRDLALRIGGPQWPVERAAGAASDTAGGFLVPPGAEDIILAFRDLGGVFRSNASNYTLATDSLTVPRRMGALPVSFVSENTTLPEDDLSWDAVSFAARKLAAFARFSNELTEDSAADIAAFFLADAGNGLALKEDDCGFNGDGTANYGGILGICPQLMDGSHDAGKVTAASGHGDFTTLDVSDIAAMMAALPTKYWPGSKLYCSGFAAGAALVRMGAATGGVQMSATGPRPQLFFAGCPVILTSRLPGPGNHSGAVMMVFGDMSSAAAVASRRGLTMAVSRSKYLENDQTACRVTERFDLVCHNLGDSVNAGALVGLVGG